MAEHATSDIGSSYFDPATTSAYYVLPLERDPRWDDSIASIRQAPDPRQRSQKLVALTNELLDTDEFYGLFVHEWHHSLQTILYPQRFLQSDRELKLAIGILQTMSKTRDSLRLDDFKLSDSQAASLVSAPWAPIYVTPVDRRLEEAGPDNVYARLLGSISEVDIIEEATSVFQFKMLKKRVARGHEYRSWLRRERSNYSRLFRLLVDVMGNDDAFAAIPSLALASFRTTTPTSTFVFLVNLTFERELRPSRIPDEEYTNFAVGGN